MFLNQETPVSLHTPKKTSEYWVQKIEYKSVRNRWGNSEKKGAVFLQRRKPFQQNVSSSKSKQHRKLYNVIQPNKICAQYTVKPSYPQRDRAV